jgi:hypothetical protein
MPRSASVQLFPSMRLSDEVTWMFAPSPAVPLPLPVHRLPEMMQSEAARMPSRVLVLTEQLVTVVQVLTTMP